MSTVKFLTLSQVFATICLIVSSLNAGGYDWQISKERQFPRAGDRLHYYRIGWDEEIASIPEFEERHSYTDSVWDMSQCGYLDNNFIIRYDRGMTGNDIVVTISNLEKRYMALCGDTVFLRGYENRNLFMSDSVGSMRRVYGSDMDSIHERGFKYCGKYSYNRPAIRCGKSSTFSGRLGTLIFPTGDTVNDVMYIRTDDISNSDISLDEDKLIKSFSDSLPMSHISIVECYAPGYRYPVLNLRRIDRVAPDTEVFRSYVAEICPPSEQRASIYDDDENTLVLDEIAEQAEKCQSPSHQKPDPIQNVSLSLEGNNLNLYFDSVISTGEVELIISDSGGIRYLHHPRRSITQGRNHLDVDCSGMPAQEYALLLIYGDQVWRLKFTLR